MYRGVRSQAEVIPGRVGDKLSSSRRRALRQYSPTLFEVKMIIDLVWPMKGEQNCVTSCHVSSPLLWETWRTWAHVEMSTRPLKGWDQLNSPVYSCWACIWAGNALLVGQVTEILLLFITKIQPTMFWLPCWVKVLFEETGWRNILDQILEG